MGGSSWSRSGRRPAPARAGEARPAGSFGVAVARARGVWDGLTGGPAVVPPVGGPGCVCAAPGEVVMLVEGTAPVLAHGPRCVARAGFYSDAAAAAIVALALGLWADTARGLVESGELGLDDDGER